nr:Uncharacterized protein conserved in bacteria [Klebsiella pneumoniae]
MEIISEWHDGAAVLYRESQTLADSSQNVRWSTAIFSTRKGKLSGAICRKPASASQRKRPRLSRGLLTENVLFAEERFDIQPLSLQNFPQATQTFYRICRTRSRVRPISRPTSSSVAAS